MQKYGISLEVIPSNLHDAQKAGQLSNKETESSPCSTRTSPMEGPCEAETLVQNSVATLGKNEEAASVPLTWGQTGKLPKVHFEDALSKKRQKLSSPDEGNSIALKATESSLFNWLKNKNGVSQLSQMKIFIILTL